MKSYSKGILVGISIVLGSLLLMGYTSSEKEVVRYQLSTTNVGNRDYIFETIIDTKTGEIISRKEVSYNLYKRILK